MPTPEELLGDFLLGPAHIGFVVENLEQSIALARELYGLDEEAIEWQPPLGESAPTRFAFFCVGGLDFEYIQPCAAPYTELLFERASGPGGINHVAWRVSNLHGAMRVLEAKGIRAGYVTPDGPVRIGERWMVYLDPQTTGGPLVELIQYPEDAA